MKKSLKILSIALLCGMMLIALTGCGNKIIATKEAEDFVTESTYEETLEISFKGDKVSKAKMTMEFEKKEAATAYYAILSLEELEEDYDVKQKGKKVIVTISGETAEDQYEDMSKEEIIEQLEDDDYEVK